MPDLNPDGTLKINLANFPKLAIESGRYPIIYVRGYAMTHPEIEETVSDPYMGFNIGSSKIRQLWDGKIGKFYFESPLVRLMKEYDYRDVFEAGDFDLNRIRQSKLVAIFRYYESASKDLGDGKVRDIENYALGLAKLILNLRDTLCGDGKNAEKDFRVYLIAHSMGGLICRSMLQRPFIADDVNKDQAGASSDKPRTITELNSASKFVDKIFTYGTPHNGIEVRGIGNVPGFLTVFDMDNFNHGRMKEYLNLSDDKDVSTLNQKFDPDRFFCLVGTNHRDYPAAAGVAREIVGPMSDGLVKIENATVKGNWNGQDINSPRAFVHRSHSGPYGLVNSEEGFQNLRRFLFGDIRVDGKLNIEQVWLPTALHDKIAKKPQLAEKLKASYHIETAVTTRGLNVYLHRRTVDENSAIIKKYGDVVSKDGTPAASPSAFLFSVFLDSKLRRKNVRDELDREALAFAVDVRVRVPDYELDGALWFDEHFQGGLILGKRYYINVIKPINGEAWQVSYRDNYEETATAMTPAIANASNTAFSIPFISEENVRPGIKAKFEIIPRLWN